MSPLFSLLFYLPLMAFALWWLVRGGRRSVRPYPKRIFLGGMGISVLLLGLGLGGYPNPVEASVDLFRQRESGEFFLFLFFALLAVAGTKLVCGWGCPFGTLQELLYETPCFRRIKSVQLPFLVTMPVRTAVFAALSIALLGWEFDLYAAVDPFRLFGLEFGRPSVLVAVVLLLILSLLVYRPFCQLLCPFGWISWFLERFSLYGIRINRRTCSRCNACAQACPLEAARGRLMNSPVPADCFSCARCLRVCGAGAIDYGPRWRRPGTRSSGK